MMSLRASVYFDWVPSKDNIADLVLLLQYWLTAAEGWECPPLHHLQHVGGRAVCQWLAAVPV